MNAVISGTNGRIKKNAFAYVSKDNSESEVKATFNITVGTIEAKQKEIYLERKNIKSNVIAPPSVTYRSRGSRNFMWTESSAEASILLKAYLKVLKISSLSSFKKGFTFFYLFNHNKVNGA